MKNFPLILIIVFLLSVGIADANVPTVLSIKNNSYSGTTSSYGIFLNNGQSITLTANSTNNSNTWNWYVDKVAITNNFNNTTQSFTKGTYHYVQVNATNGTNVSNTIYWGINVLPAMATLGDQITLLNETPSQDFASAIENNSLQEIVHAPITVYLNLIGLSFYAFVWFIAFGMVWVKQSSINIPAVIGVIFGGIIITFLPPQYQLVAQVLTIFGIFAIIYIFYKGRG